MVGISVLTGLLCIFAGIIALVATDDGNEDVAKKCKYCLLMSLCISILFSLLYVFIPSTQQASLLYCVPKIMVSDASQQVATDAEDIYGLAVERIKRDLAK